MWKKKNIAPTLPEKQLLVLVETQGGCEHSGLHNHIASHRAGEFPNNLNKNYNFRVVDSELSCVTQISTPTSMGLIFVTCYKCKIYIQVIGKFALIVLCHTS